MPRKQAITCVPAAVLTRAYDALGAHESAASVWRRLLKGHGIELRTWQGYAREHLRRRHARAEWDRLSICRQLNPNMVRACEKAFCLETWARLRRQSKHKARSKGAIDVLACRQIRERHPDLRVRPRTLAAWRQRYARITSSDKFSAAVADLLGITLSTRRRT